jgi:hypothetical protein
MIEKIVLDYLNETLNVSVYMEKPASPPEEYVLLEKTGSSSENYIKSATIALQSYAKTLYSAAALNEEAKKAMDNIVSLNEVMRSELNSDYNFTDTTKKQYRYQAIYDLFY